MASRRRRIHPDAVLVFPELQGHRTSNYWEDMREALNMAHDEEFVMHVCRHTFCTRLLQAGVDLPTIRDLAGHSCFETTLRYAKVLDNGRTAAILKMVRRQPDLIRVSSGHAPTRHSCDNVTNTDAGRHAKRAVSA